MLTAATVHFHQPRPEVGPALALEKYYAFVRLLRVRLHDSSRKLHVPKVHLINGRSSRHGRHTSKALSGKF